MSKQNFPTRNYFDALDGMRGVGAILVSMRHTAQFYAPITFQESYLAVDLFFVLSGVVVANAYEAKLVAGRSVLEFLRVRLIRLAPLYLLGGMLGLLGALWTGSYTWGQLLVLALIYCFYIPNIFCIGGDRTLYPLNGPAWSLFFELVANIGYAVLVKFLSIRRLAAFCTVCAIGLIWCVSVWHKMDVGYIRSQIPDGLLRVGYSFFIGIILFRFYLRCQAPVIRGARASLITSMVLIVAAIVLCGSPGTNVQPYFDIVAVLFVFPALVFGALFLRPEGIMGRVCRFMGVTSYAVYALHVPIKRLVTEDVQDFVGLNIASYAPVAGFVFFAALITLCASIDRWFDSPIRRYLSRSTQNWAAQFLSRQLVK